MDKNKNQNQSDDTQEKGGQSEATQQDVKTQDSDVAEEYEEMDEDATTNS